MRQCAYKDCDNCIVNGAPSPGFTLFQFPKDPERRNLWIQLGKVDPQLPARELYMCSEHFDSKKYMSINNRRTILVGAALPFEYKPLLPLKEAEDLTGNEQEEVDVMMIGEPDLLSEEETNSGMILELEDNEACFLKIDGEEEDAFAEEEYEESENLTPEVITEDRFLYRKRKIITDRTKEASDTLPSIEIKKLNVDKIIRTKRPTNKVQLEATSTPSEKTAPQFSQKNKNVLLKDVQTPTVADNADGNFDVDGLIDTKHVTKFIFKGEEYVQMPKEHYVQEKVELMRKLKRYKCLIKSIKQQVNDLDLS